MGDYLEYEAMDELPEEFLTSSNVGDVDETDDLPY